jgi:hypothetical protein
MLSALLNKLEPGRICDIVEQGKEFEVHENFYWVGVPDDTTTSDTYNEDGTITKFDILNQPGFKENAYLVARSIAYQSVGTQLDMLFHELNTTGSISNTGVWATHIAAVKSAIPKDNAAAVLEWNQKYWESIQANNTTITINTPNT